MASSVPGEERGQGWIDRLRSVGHGQPYHAAGIENRGGERGVRSAAPAGDPPEPLEQNGGIRYWTPTADQAWPTEVTCGLAAPKRSVAALIVSARACENVSLGTM